MATTRSPQNKQARAFRKLWNQQSTSLKKKLLPVLRNQQRAAVDRLESLVVVEKSIANISKNQYDPQDAFLIYPVGSESAVRSAATSEMTRIAEIGAGRQFENIIRKQIGSLTLETQERISDMLDESFGMDYWVANFGEATRRRISNLLFQAVVEGWTPAEVVEALRADRFGIFNAARAERIARTETTSMLNGGAWLARRELWREDIITEEVWNAILDRDTRNNHRFAHKQKITIGPEGGFVVQDINGTTIGQGPLFVLGSERARFPGDPNLSAGNRVNCRCDVIAEVAV